MGSEDVARKSDESSADGFGIFLCDGAFLHPGRGHLRERHPHTAVKQIFSLTDTELAGDRSEEGPQHIVLPAKLIERGSTTRFIG